MLQLLRTRRWAGFTALVIGAIIGFGLLSHWQWTRAETKRAERLELESAAAADPQQLATGAGPVAWAPVSASGQYVAGTEVAVRKRPLDATNGFWIMTALRLPDGATAWVNRGWLEATGAATAAPDMPPAPAGPVEVTGWWRDFEEDDGQPSTLPAGMIANVSPTELGSTGGFAGYLQLAESTPAEAGLRPVPRETIDEGRNISYALQWLMFAAVAIVGWFFFLRREAREDAEPERLPQ